jgi:CubicO group peptidase (beta-lactamase class C family)
MTRTTASLNVLKKDQNVATQYVTLTDGSMVAVDPPCVSDTYMDGEAGGIWSSVSDLLRWCRANLDSLQDKSANALREIRTLTRATTIIDPDSPADGIYCLGWVRQSTPAKLGPISPNRRFRSPLVGESAPSVQVISRIKAMFSIMLALSTSCRTQIRLLSH